LFLTICSNDDIIKSCEIIDFFSSTYIYLKSDLRNTDFDPYINADCIDDYLFETGEYAVSYREIEYIEFKKISEQDTDKIKEILSKIGKFEWAETEEYLRIKGYE
jgi:hypothetical protein